MVCVSRQRKWDTLGSRVKRELEGFIDGLFGHEEVIDLPERANEALSYLTDINAILHGILDLIAREPAPSA